MAKNWNVREFAEALSAGGDTKRDAIFDAGRRFPLTANLVSTIMATNGADGFKEFLVACPDWMTMRKIESVLKDGVNAPAEDETPEAVEEEAPKPEKKPRGRKAKKEVVEEETAEEEKPAKKEKKAKAPKKAKKEKVEEPEEAEEEEDEWEI